VANSPYKNPTNLENPSPAAYDNINQNISKDIEKAKMLTIQSSAGLDIPETDGSPNMKLNSTFNSNVKRDFLDSVSKDIKLNPGPGSYLHD
jgi:hypothetical protein